MRVGLIGFGAIGRSVAAILSGDAAVDIAGVLVRPGRGATVGPDLPPGCRAVETIEDLLALKPDVVAECAGQPAVAEHGPAVLAAGIDLIVIAVGALADDDLRRSLVETAERAGSRIHLPAGAIAGIDGLSALAIGGLDEVHYTSVKPPGAWRGTPAEARFDLGGMTGRTVLFEGSARDATTDYPKNANIAAIVALAGIGLDRTRVALVADPSVTTNCGRIDARGALGTLTLEMDGRAEPGNDKTSASTAYSVARTIRNMSATVVI